MHIIFDDVDESLREKHIVLELDTFVDPKSGETRKAYCVIENISLTEFPVVGAYVSAHHDMMDAYHSGHWEYCRHALSGLTGKWNGEMDSFYQALSERIGDQDSPPEHFCTAVSRHWTTPSLKG